MWYTNPLSCRGEAEALIVVGLFSLAVVEICYVQYVAEPAVAGTTWRGTSEATWETSHSSVPSVLSALNSSGT